MPAERHMCCLECGYILEGLPENRCPECGRPFDPDDPDTIRSARISGRQLLTRAALGLFALTSPFFGFWGVFSTEWYIFSAVSWLLDLILIFVFFFGLCLTIATGVHSVRFFWLPEHLVEHRLGGVLAIVLILLWTASLITWLIV